MEKMKKIKKFNESSEPTKKSEIIDLLYKYRTDFSLEGTYTDFGIREEDFDKLADDIVEVFRDIK